MMTEGRKGRVQEGGRGGSEEGREQRKEVEVGREGLTEGRKKEDGREKEGRKQRKCRRKR